MILTLSHRTLMAIREAVDDRRMLGYLEAGSEYASTNRWDVDLPAVAWRALLPVLEARAFNKRGEWAGKYRAAGLAYRRIQAALLALEVHPAYEGRASIDPFGPTGRLIGFADGPKLSPYPPGHLVVLDPEIVEVSVDLGSGPVNVEAIRWEMRHPAAFPTMPYTEPYDHEGWLPAPAAAER